MDPQTGTISVRSRCLAASGGMLLLLATGCGSGGGDPDPSAVVATTVPDDFCQRVAAAVPEPGIVGAPVKSGTGDRVSCEIDLPSGGRLDVDAVPAGADPDAAVVAACSALHTAATGTFTDQQALCDVTPKASGSAAYLVAQSGELIVSYSMSGRTLSGSDASAALAQINVALD